MKKHTTAHDRWVDQIDLKGAEQQFGCILAVIVVTGLICLLLTFLIVIFKP